MWVIVKVLEGNTAAVVLGWVVKYVDDILSVAIRNSGKSIITAIMTHWNCSDMEVLGTRQIGFLGMTLCQMPRVRLFVHQMEYIKGLLAKHQLESANPSKVILPV